MSSHNSKNFGISIIIALLFIVLLVTPLSTAKDISPSKSIRIASRVLEEVEEGENVSVLVSLKDKISIKSFKTSDFSSNRLIKNKYFVTHVDKNKLDELSNNPEVERIYYNHRFGVFLQDSIPLINVSTVHALKTTLGVNLTGKGQSVCILDTGVNYSHPDLGGVWGNKVIAGWRYTNNSVPGINCTANNSACRDDHNYAGKHGHGTHVAGIVAANGSIKGAAPEANIVVIKVLNNTGYGTEADIAKGIEWCTNYSNRYNISAISVSIGTATYHNDSFCDGDFPLLTSAIDYARANNVSVVIATGNEANFTAISSPACIANATRVCATNKADGFYASGNRGGDFTDILLAPGVSINSTRYTLGYESKTGTSMAAPHISGVLALLLQYKKQEEGETLLPAEFIDILNSTGLILDDSQSGRNYSRIDVYNALISIDNKSPIINITYPSNDSTYTSLGNYSLNFTISEVNLNTSSCGYSINQGSNVSIPNCQNTTFNISSSGQYNLTLYARDYSNNINQSIITFEVDYTPPGVINFTIDKSAVNSEYNVSEVIEYIVNITNTGNVNLSLVNINDTFNNSFLSLNSSSVAHTSNGTGWIYWFNVTEGSVIQPNESFVLYVNMTAVSNETDINNSVSVYGINEVGGNEIVAGFHSNVDNEVKIYDYHNINNAWVESNVSGNLSTANGIAIGDADNDGNNEVVVAFWDSAIVNEVKIYNGSGSNWDENNVSGDLTDAWCVTIGDADNDGNNEIVAGFDNSIDTQVIMYNGSGSNWDENNVSWWMDDAFDVAIGDADNDGNNEVVVGYDTDILNEVKMYNGSGSNWDEDNISSELNYMAYAVAIGDADNDGNNEVVVGFQGATNALRMYSYNFTNSNWTEINISGLDDVESVAIGDADNDGNNEVVVAFWFIVHDINVYKYNSSNNSWYELNVSRNSDNAYKVTVGDADNDEDSEIVASFYDANYVRIYEYNTTNNNWTESDVSTGLDDSYAVAIGDADNDIVIRSDYVLINITNETQQDDNGNGDDDNNGGGGGRSSRGLGSIIVTSDQPSKTQIFSQISPGEELEMNLDSKNIPVSKLSVSSNELLNNVEVTVTSLDEKPEGLPLAPNIIYEYFSITSSTDKIGGTISFKINRSWINENNIDTSKIYLFRYDTNWEKFNTRRIGEDKDYLYYSATVHAFSYFAISGEEVEEESEVIIYPDEPVVEDKPPEVNKTEKIEDLGIKEEEGDPYFEISIYITIIFVLLTIILIEFYIRRREQ
ncbi:MAG: S8 family serine peptidase [Candidatus Woesearchaeota archaeon]|nr:MAG: S8 family serine peptidase [Candidatus Woesearchaeota archaeon]